MSKRKIRESGRSSRQPSNLERNKVVRPEIEEIKKGFDLFDVKGTGKILPSEMRETMEEMGLQDKNPMIYKLVCSLDIPQYNNQGGITFDEYVNAVDKTLSDNQSKEGIRDIFDFFNNDPESDSIPLSVFVKAAKELHEDVTEAELKDLLTKSGCTGSELTFDEFYDMMTRVDYYRKK